MQTRPYEDKILLNFEVIVLHLKYYICCVDTFIYFKCHLCEIVEEDVSIAEEYRAKNEHEDLLNTVTL